MRELLWASKGIILRSIKCLAFPSPRRLRTKFSHPFLSLWLIPIPVGFCSVTRPYYFCLLKLFFSPCLEAVTVKPSWMCVPRCLAWMEGLVLWPAMYLMASFVVVPQWVAWCWFKEHSLFHMIYDKTEIKPGFFKFLNGESSQFQLKALQFFHVKLFRPSQKLWASQFMTVNLWNTKGKTTRSDGMSPWNRATVTGSVVLCWSSLNVLVGWRSVLLMLFLKVESSLISAICCANSCHCQRLKGP